MSDLNITPVALEIIADFAKQYVIDLEFELDQVTPQDDAEWFEYNESRAKISRVKPVIDHILRKVMERKTNAITIHIK